MSLSSICSPVDFLACGGDELLVGRAGFLCGALWLEKVFGAPVVPIADLHKVCQTIIISGRSYAQRTKSSCPLMYSYYGTEYLGKKIIQILDSQHCNLNHFLTVLNRIYCKKKFFQVRHMA